MFGDQTVTFVSYTDTGSAGALGTYPQAETLTEATGCRHRALKPKETAEYDVNVSTRLWRSTIPVGEYGQTVRDAVLSAKSDDEIRVDGVSYKIVGGPEPHPDMAGDPFKVTLLSQIQSG